MVKGQVKIQQTAFMLIAITLFFVLVGLFAVKMSFSGLKDRATNLDAENALLMVSNIANTPEFSCEEAFGGTKTNCIDFDKAMVIKNNIEKYKGFWGVDNIELRRIYPPGEEILCTEESYPECNLLRIISDETVGIGISSFVSLCKKDSLEGKTYNKCDLAEMSIFYTKK